MSIKFSLYNDVNELLIANLTQVTM